MAKRLKRIVPRGTPPKEVRHINALTTAIKEGRPTGELVGHLADVAVDLGGTELAQLLRQLGKRMEGGKRDGPPT